MNLRYGSARERFFFALASRISDWWFAFLGSSDWPW